MVSPFFARQLYLVFLESFQQACFFTDYTPFNFIKIVIFERFLITLFDSLFTLPL